MTLAPIDVIRPSAGVLILAVGIFVLAARPHAGINRLFFVLALVDGVSTILFGLSEAVQDPELALYFRATYWWFFLAFVALLAAFALVFPLPLSRRGATSAGLALVGLLAVLGIFAFVTRRDLFLAPRVTPEGVQFLEAPGINLAGVAFTAATALVALRMGAFLLGEGSESHRRQAAFVLGGMLVAFAPFAVTVTVQALLLRPAVYLGGRADRLAAFWAFGLFTLGLAVLAVRLATVRGARLSHERRAVLAAFGVVGALALFAAIFPTATAGALLRSVALLAYPVLLGYAIARYEVFDIDRRLRRAATVTLSAVGLTLAFVLAENAAENVIAERVFAGVSSEWVSGSFAAVLAAGVSIPVARASRVAAGRLVPELSKDEVQIRKLEIYRHSVAGALADGIIRDNESRTLAALRESLGISDADHERIFAEVAA